MPRSFHQVRKFANRTLEAGGQWVGRSLRYAIWLALLLSLLISRSTAAQAGPRVIHWERSVKMDEAMRLQPVGLAFSTRSQTFYMLEQGGADLTLRRVSAYGEALGTVTLALPSAQVFNLTYDDRGQRLLLWHGAQQALYTVAERSDGSLDPATLTSVAVTPWGIAQVAGMAFDNTRGHLYLLDGASPRLLRVVADANGSWAAATVTPLPLALPVVQTQGLAYDPMRDHLQVVAQETQMLYELTLTGEVVGERDLSPFGLHEGGGVAFAPSGDLTDDPQLFNLYLVDPGRSGPGRGGLVEFTLVEPAQSPAAWGGMDPSQVQAASLMPLLVQTIESSQWSPPSPDPTGLAYLPGANVFLLADSEVDETVTISNSGQLVSATLYANVNMWRMTPAGAVVGTSNTIAFSDEPIDLAFNPANQHLFISDDAGYRGVYEVDPGPDRLYGSGDDVMTSFRTGIFGNSLGFGALDPEGLDYAGDLDVLFIADATNDQVYRVAPGRNGVFDGVAPSGDDQVTDFDTENLGITQPEGIAYNPLTGSLFLVGTNKYLVFEVTTAGKLVQLFDITHLNATRLSDLAFAPNSQNPAAMSLYLLDRGIDNNALPDRLPNDGKVYEITWMPIANDDRATGDEDTAVVIDVGANDTDMEGQPIAGSIRYPCPTCTKPAHGTLTHDGTGSFVYTPDQDFNGSDRFVYLLCDDRKACDTAAVTVDVNPVNDPPVANDDHATTVQDIPVNIDVAANDTDVDGNLVAGSINEACAVSAGSCTGAVHGVLGRNRDSSFVYLPDPGFTGVDSFVYEICDSLAACDTATVVISVVDSIDLYLPLIK